MNFRWVIACALLVWPTVAAAQPSAPQLPATPPDGVTRLVDTILKATEAGDGPGIRALATPAVGTAQLSEFAQSLTFPRATRFAVKERDRAATPDGKIRVLLETFTERSGEGRVSSWRLDVEPGSAESWVISSIERLTMVGGLFRLALDTSTEYDVHNLVVSAPDLTLTLPSGTAFVSKTPDGPTALVLLGRGRMKFSPAPEAERGQVRIFSGSEVLEADFDSAFLRLVLPCSTVWYRPLRCGLAPLKAGTSAARRRSSTPTCPRAFRSISTT
jgi:hypothetical protein